MGEATTLRKTVSEEKKKVTKSSQKAKEVTGQV